MCKISNCRMVSSTSSSARSYRRRGNNFEMDYEGPAIFYHCGVKALRWASWMENNPGRRFYG